MSFIRLLQASASIALMLGLGCSSTPLRSPPGASLELNTQWLKDYKLARNLEGVENEKSCSLYKRLAEDQRFPAHQLSEVRAWAICAKDLRPDLKPETLPPWLKELSQDIALDIAVRDGNKSAELELTTERSKRRLPQHEKLKWLDRATELAKELNAKEELAQLTKRRYIIAPRLNPKPRLSQYLDLANDHRMAREFEKARWYYERVIKNRAFRLNQKITAFKGIRLSYKNARQHEAHAEASKRLVRYLERAEKRNRKSALIRRYSYDAQLYYGRALWTLHRASEAKAVFSRCEKRMKGKISLAELYWLQGRMAEEAGDFTRVTEAMNAALNEPISDPELRDKILWYSAWNERRQKNFARASEILTQLDEKTQSDFTRVRALYWLGKTLEEMNQKDYAKQTLERLISIDTFGYYGILAHRHLGLGIAFKSLEDPGGSPDQQLEKVPLDVQLSEWLALLEERDALKSLLNISVVAYRKQKEQSIEGWNLIFAQYAKGGLYGRMYEALGSIDPDQRRMITEQHPELLFPQPWNDSVRLAALQHSVDEELIYAIMRQESAFDPRARSQADAFGLMQILPEVAEAVATDHKIAYSQLEHLYTPAVNIQLGTAHIKTLLERHKGQFILAVASYNASENAIRNWMKTRYRGDALEFIEEIPYEETRSYVRLVMRNMIYYSLLKSRSASIKFPAWVLKLDPGSV